MKESIKKAFESAEQETQEKEIANLKKIILNLLNSKKEKETAKDKLDKEIRLIKQSIDDFKAGRLDKVKELIEKNEDAKQVVPLIINIINNNNYPTKPWLWNYNVEWIYFPYQYNQSISNNYSMLPCNGATSTSNVIYTCGPGNTLATFTSGTYNLDNGQTINL